MSMLFESQSFAPSVVVPCGGPSTLVLLLLFLLFVALLRAVPRPGVTSSLVSQDGNWRDIFNFGGDLMTCRRSNLLGCFFLVTLAPTTTTTKKSLMTSVFDFNDEDSGGGIVVAVSEESPRLPSGG